MGLIAVVIPRVLRTLRAALLSRWRELPVDYHTLRRSRRLRHQRQYAQQPLIDLTQPQRISLRSRPTSMIGQRAPQPQSNQPSPLPAPQHPVSPLSTIYQSLQERLSAIWRRWQHPQSLPPQLGSSQPHVWLVLRSSPVIASVTVTGAVLIGQQLGWFQSFELKVYDRMVRWTGDQHPDSRLLIVKITEADIQAQKRWPLADQTFANALKQLQKHRPRAIGLDVYRDLPYEPGHRDLVTQLRFPNVVTITKLGSESDLGVPPPPTVVPQQVGFNDVVLDPDSVVRRNLMFGSTDKGNVFSFSFRLAALYLNAQQIRPRYDGNYIYWGKAKFSAIQPSSGAYHSIDAYGYQIMLRYRSAQNVARQVTLTDVLKGNLNPAWVRNKVVLIGVTAPSLKDFFLSPYSPTEQDTTKMPGVVVHAQMVSQLLTAASGEPALIWYWPDWAEAVWVLAWAAIGGLVAWRVHHPMMLGVCLLLGLGGTIGAGLLTYHYFGWIPVVAPALAFVLTVGGVVTYTIYQFRQEQQFIIAQAQEQEKTIALLRTLLAEQSTEKSPRPAPVVSPAKGQVTHLQHGTIADVAATKEPSLGAQAVRQGPKRDGRLDDADITLALTPDGAVISRMSASPEATASSHVRPLHATALKTAPQSPFDHANSLLNQRYQLIKILGSGGFGTTYLAEDTLRPGNPECVVKRLMPARRDDRFLQTARRLFRTEAEILEKLGRHDQIPQLLAAFEEDAEFYLVQEFIAGHTLASELAEKQRLSEPAVISIMQDTLAVLEFIHDRHVIHRDLKPGNLIRRDSDQRLVLIDFGAVKQIQPQETSTEGELATVAIGTRGYAPAEQLAGYPTFNSDLYALGMICIQALTGQIPQRLELDFQTGNIIWQPLASVSAGLAAILDRMVCYYFSDRYQSAREVMKDLKPLLDAK
ncbi:MAG: CHASE2 domain-containing serine/threonine-protein kinase [Cyanobacteria bacterium]|nr:CHASE2 domain-containing serine/threonine-protein kinase [Cyanobacteriota bacterium]MDW8202610.1 CHASE2 domain-containing serine/threonine-protein kinase [Cyanobacteriota bacterium SKYGB_h_bin112]